MSANLILHWMLDQLGDGKTVADETENHLDGTYTGSPKIVPDEKFGSCLSFNGSSDSISVADTEALRLPKYTVEVWVKPERNEGWQGVVGKPGRNYNVWLVNAAYVHHRFYAGSKWNAGAPNTEAGSIVWGKWHHIAITNDGETARTYINGLLKAEGAVEGELKVKNTQLLVGRSLDGKAEFYYKGCMAHLRLYDNALLVEEIRRDMIQDESAASAFVRSHPIEFELYNEDNHHVLFIDDHPQGQTLYLDILNSSTQNIELQDIGEIAKSQNYHFELRFRPETIARANLSKIAVATKGWSLDRATDGTALYLLHKGATTLAAGEKFALQLTRMNADGQGGTRGTRVEMGYGQMRYVGEDGLLQGYRLQYLDIVNHRGRRNIPLHVGFVGTDTVFSDGTTPNTLRIRIANLSRDFGLLLSKGDATTAPSRFQISFDVQEEGENREWALMNHGNVNGVSLHVKQTHAVSSNWADPEKRNLGQTVEWTISPNENTTLGADGYIILEIRDLISLASIGHAKIYINFANIPGYQDQQMTVVVQKSPLLYSNSNVRIDGSLSIQKNAVPEAENNYHLEVYSPNTNDFNNYTKIRFHQGDQYWAWLGYHGTAQDSSGEFVFWNLNQSKEAKLRVGDLDVKGDIRLGANADLFAWATQKKVRIVMGTIERNGTYQGTGFTCHRTGEGSYRLRFTPPFSQEPIILTGPGEKAMPIVYPGVWGDGDTLVYCRNFYQNPIEDKPTDARFYFLAIGA